MNALVTRSDWKVKPSFDDVCKCFETSPYPHLASFVSRVDDGEVVLAGESASFHSKQLAQNVALRCPGIVRVRNLIRVKYPRP